MSQPITTYEMNVNTRNFSTLIALKTMTTTASAETTTAMTVPHIASAGCTVPRSISPMTAYGMYDAAMSTEMEQ